MSLKTPMFAKYVAVLACGISGCQVGATSERQAKNEMAEQISVIIMSVNKNAPEYARFEIQVTNDGESEICIPNYDGRDIVALYRVQDRANLLPAPYDEDDPIIPKRPPLEKVVIPAGTELTFTSLVDRELRTVFFGDDGLPLGRLQSPQSLVADVAIPVFPCRFADREAAAKHGFKDIVLSGYTAPFVW